ncbi:serine protease, subtilase family protein [Plesiocystis pacifica SIR-1]|uniref:Serine protease, subtilase family protein n=1 Tax=Plesiocystis pacifica SIR-1 TaxID=391625 RepID=A6GHZ0_9BACT|nr:serine protease, subtilase family protein [Plesiocystis pacifica SIR-1]
MGSLWRAGVRGQGVEIGHLDSGVAEHPVLRRRVAAFLDTDARGRPAGEHPRDELGHGTHTAAIVCGGSVEGLAIGAAPRARLRSAAVIDAGDNLVRILRGLDWLRGSGVRVLCMALGFEGDNPVLWTMLEALRREGVLSVCAIGNHGPARPLSPARYPGVLSVGAITEAGEVPGYCARVLDDAGRCVAPALLAPGTFASADSRGEGLRTMGGTSQACALVAGIAALLASARPRATPGQLASALIRGARPIEGLESRCRHGLVDARRALELLGTHGQRGFGPRPVEPPFFRDPALMKTARLGSSFSGGVVRCIVIASSRAADHPLEGRAASILARVSKATRQQPKAVEYFPVARAAVVEASPRFIHALAMDSRVRVLSPTRAENRYRL